MKQSLYILMSMVLFSCAGPIGFTNAALPTSYARTDYVVEEFDGGFTLSVFYLDYQLRAEYEAFAAVCKSQLTSIAYSHASNFGREIVPLREQLIRMSLDRNDATEQTSCQANVLVEWSVDA